ncbi:MULTISPECIES: hypothetical protein [Sutcliffiella]|uniref:Uncharacterized protein n=1 Tax=Sutcliffiella cohnii TaxID=33932 RepID=A0A223KKU0_9BACI|nr:MULTISPECIES: hypothetical protein [Sutcliffiella]AST90091.1 hypothetical protein BC6307_01730 [Sutcliffiella cohnii]WBL15723.1 hypothetical protein O1A01_03475 [Sutcliffiella sp. NC1]
MNSDIYIEQIKDLHSKGDYQSLQKLFMGDNSISFVIEKDVAVKETGLLEKHEMSTSNFTTMDIRGKSVSRLFSREATESSGRFTKEWITRLSGYYSYDARTNRVTNVQSPTLRLDTATFGSAFTPYIDSVSTTGTNLGTSARFNATYTMKAIYGIPLGGDFPLSQTLNFGSFTDSFINAPLQ